MIVLATLIRIVSLEPKIQWIQIPLNTFERMHISTALIVLLPVYPYSLSHAMCHDESILYECEVIICNASCG